MTEVSIKRFRPDGVNVPGVLLATQQIRVYPSRTINTGDGELLPIPKTISLANGGTILNLLPTTLDTDGGRPWAWIFQEVGRVGSGPGGSLRTVYKFVPAAGERLSFENLVTVDPATLGPVQSFTTAQEARLAALEAGGGGGGGGGGPITSALITDSTQTGRAIVTATDAAAVRTAAGAASATDLTALSSTVTAQGTAINGKAPLSHTHTVSQVTGALAASSRGIAGGVAGLNGLGQVIDSAGSPVGAARGIQSTAVDSSGNLIITYTDGSTSNAGKVAVTGGVALDSTGHIADSIVPTSIARTQYVDQKFATQVDLSNTPLILDTVPATGATGVYPARPATNRPVWFNNPEVQPTGNGSLTGGGGAVPGRDVWVR